MEIRPIKTEEISLVAAMWKTFAEDQFQYSSFFQRSPDWQRHLEQAFRNGLPDPDFLLAGAFCDSQLTGYVFAQVIEYPAFLEETRHCNIRHLYVEDGHRNNKYGEQPLSRATNWSKNKGVNRIEVLVASGNEKACRFYNRHGFEEHIKHLFIQV